MTRHLFFLAVKLITREVRKLRMSITALNAAIAQLQTDVNTLEAQNANTVPQADVDAATTAVQAIDATVVAAIAPKS